MSAHRPMVPIVPIGLFAVTLAVILAAVLIATPCLTTPSAIAQEAPRVTPLETDVLASGTISDATPRHLFSITARADETVVISVQSDLALDLWFASADLEPLPYPENVLLHELEFWVEGESVKAGTFPAAGTYYLGVGRARDEQGSGAFTLWLNQPAILTPDTPIRGETHQRFPDADTDLVNSDQMLLLAEPISRADQGYRLEYALQTYSQSSTLQVFHTAFTQPDLSLTTTSVTTLYGSFDFQLPLPRWSLIRISNRPFESGFEPTRYDLTLRIVDFDLMRLARNR